MTQIHGLRELNDRMLKLPAKVAGRILLDSQKEAMAPVLQTAKRNAPRDTGNLVDNIAMGRGRVRNTKLSRAVIVGIRVDRDFIRSRDSRLNREGGAMYAIFQELGYTIGPTVKQPRPFLYPAFQVHADELPRRLRDGLQKRLHKVVP